MADTNVTVTPVAAAVDAAQQAKNGMKPTETVTAETVQTTEPADPRLEALARKERQLHKMRKEIESERASVKQKLSEYETGYIPKQRLQEDPFGALSELGLTHDKLTEILLNSPNMNDPVMRNLTAKIKALEDKQNNAIKAQEEAQAAQYKDAVKQIGNEVKQLVSTSEAYEMIKETAMEEAVVELIEQTYNSEGFLMDIEEACKQVEDHLMAEGEKLARTKKVQSRLAPKAVETKPESKAQPSNSQIKTLTNAMGTKPSTRLTDKERRERAIAAFQGKLNQ